MTKKNFGRENGNLCRKKRHSEILVRETFFRPPTPNTAPGLRHCLPVWPFGAWPSPLPINSALIVNQRPSIKYVTLFWPPATHLGPPNFSRIKNLDKIKPSEQNLSRFSKANLKVCFSVCIRIYACMELYICMLYMYVCTHSYKCVCNFYALYIRLQTFRPIHIYDLLYMHTHMHTGTRTCTWLHTYMCLYRGFALVRRGFVLKVLSVPPSVRIHPLQQKVKHHFQFQVSYVGLWLKN